MNKKAPALVIAVLATLPASFGTDAPANNAAAPQQWESMPFSLVPRAFQRDPRLDLSVITEVTKDGHAIPAPSADHPTYYKAYDAGEIDKGDPIGGETPPKQSTLRTAMIAALRVNGYLPAESQHPPTQLIHFMWGSYNKLTFGKGQNDLKLQNLAARASIVGGDQFARDMMEAYVSGGMIYESFKLKDPHNDWLTQLARSNLYYIIATSFDFDAALHRQLKVLWRTKMSTSSRGLTMDESVPTLVANSGAYFGKETAGPARLVRPTIKDGHVEIGTPTVRGYDDPAAAAPPSK